MGRSFRVSKSGFTLVELSIVLVIIGLLIGGILVAQSLIDSAKIQRVIGEANSYSSAVRLFKERFRYFPGDFPEHGFCDGAPNTRACVGNGNGQVEVSVTVTGASNNPQYETGGAWYQLKTAGFLSNKELPFNTVPDHVNRAAPGDNYPGLSYNKENVMELSYTDLSGDIYTGTFGSMGVQTNGLVVGTPQIGGAHTGPLYGAIKPIDALTIDKKMDDGIYNSGEVMSANSFHVQAMPNRCINAGQYVVENPDEYHGCKMLFFIEP